MSGVFVNLPATFLVSSAGASCAEDHVYSATCKEPGCGFADAAASSCDGARELAVKSQRTEKEEVLVSVSDTGVWLPAQQADQIFKAFFTTKPHGTGMGLSISRSIVESHDGRLWASENSPRGTSFYFTLRTKAEAHE